MTDKEIKEELTNIYQQLNHLADAVKMLLDESIKRENEGIFKEMDETIREFFEGAMKHGKNVE